jgi:hypothetical protein
MIVELEKITVGDIVCLKKYEPYERTEYIKFYRTLRELLEHPYSHYVLDPLNPKQHLYVLVIKIDTFPRVSSLKEQIRAIKILYKTKTLWTHIENTIIQKDQL